MSSSASSMMLKSRATSSTSPLWAAVRTLALTSATGSRAGSRALPSRPAAGRVKLRLDFTRSVAVLLIADGDLWWSTKASRVSARCSASKVSPGHILGYRQIPITRQDTLMGVFLRLCVETHHASDRRHLHPEKHSPRSCHFDRSSTHPQERSTLFVYACA